MTLVTDTDSLSALCDRLASERYVAVDTEFMRDKTYYAKLCLVQLAGAEEVAAVDTLAPGLDLAPLYALMADPNVLKVFHAARQDVEIFVHQADAVPAPLFDTQIAGMVCGFGDAVSYDRLVRGLTGVRLDKTSRFTDWSHRPLTTRQVDYALADVIHLRPAYERLHKRLEKTGRLEWLSEEMAVLTDPKTYRVAPEDAWRRLKIRSTKPKFLTVLRELAAWREREAQQRDVPRNRILRDDALVDVAAQLPQSPEELARSRAFNRESSSGKTGRAILEAVERALALPKEDWPTLPEQADTPQGRQPVADLLRVLLKIKCEESDVAPKLIASSDDLDAIAASDDADVPAMRGWRREVFGEAALAVKHGRLGMVFDPEKDRVRLFEPQD
ncbi:MAG: ribonuclease D [Thalassobaculum sp.]|uniref:ribonuclease D n=1 Tax=Thalassobaculum sp. TaxID=2022740 RepID=UPI0032EF2DF0